MVCYWYISQCALGYQLPPPRHPSKTPPPLSSYAPPLNWQTVQASPPLFRQSFPLYWFSVSPRKSQIFQWIVKVFRP